MKNLNLPQNDKNSIVDELGHRFKSQAFLEETMHRIRSERINLNTFLNTSLANDNNQPQTKNKCKM